MAGNSLLALTVCDRAVFALGEDSFFGDLAFGGGAGRGRRSAGVVDDLPGSEGARSDDLACQLDVGSHNLEGEARYARATNLALDLGANGGAVVLLPVTERARKEQSGSKRDQAVH